MVRSSRWFGHPDGSVIQAVGHPDRLSLLAAVMDDLTTFRVPISAKFWYPRSPGVSGVLVSEALVSAKSWHQRS
jgi:hypothetical protein